jgi:hypothetical protein
VKTWRGIVVGVAVLSLGLIIASAWLFDWGPLWRAWRGPLAVRSAGSWLGGMDEPQGPLQRVGLQLSGLVSQYLVALLIAYVAPRHVRRMADSLSRGSRAIARSFAIGLLFTVALTAIILLASMSIHMFPVPILLAVIVFLAALVGVVALAYQTGRLLLTRAAWAQDSPLASLGLGTLILYGLTQVPFFGLLVLIALSLTGVGAALSTRFGSRGRWSLAPLTEENPV